MLFWGIAAALAAIVAYTLARPLLRDAAPLQGRNSDVELYTAQLAEIDRDLERDILDQAAAEQARTEVSRRLLSAHAAAQPDAKTRRSPVAAAVVGILALGISFAAYPFIGAPGTPDQPLAARLEKAAEMRINRPDQAALEAAAPPQPPLQDVPEDYLANIEELRTLMPSRPDDPRGWELLAFHEAELRNFAAAARAQENFVRILGDQAATLDLQRQLDLMALATDGYISPEAEEVLRIILERDEDNVAALYHLGALFYQTDRADVAFRLWRPLVENEPDGYHVALARAQIESAAARAGIDYTAPEVKGPTAADIANAQDMSPEDRAQMIEGMVANLSDRLATQGGTAEDWARLITAYGVLGNTEQAGTIWAEAQGVFATDPDAMTVLRNAAASAGLTE